MDGNLTEKGGSDYYKITVPEAGTLTITYQGLGIGYSWFYLYDEDISERYKQSSIVNNTSETNPKTQDMAVDLQKGTYQVRVAGHAGDCTGTYRLKASFEPIGSNEVEPNDTYQTAMPLAGTQKITGFLPVNEEQDFYRFVLTKDTMVDIKYINHYNGGLPKPGVDGIIAVYDENYQEVDRTRPINDQYEFCEMLSAGTYYIKVTKFYGGSGMYILQYSDTHTHTWDDGRVTEAAAKRDQNYILVPSAKRLGRRPLQRQRIISVRRQLQLPAVKQENGKKHVPSAGKPGLQRSQC